MTALRRVYLCCFLVLAVLGTALPVQAQSESEPSSEPDSITLEQEMSLEVPATGGRLLLSDASALDPTGGVLVEPGTDSEELVEYQGIEEDALVGIVRDEPRAHETGVPVAQSEEDPSSPSPAPTTTPTILPSVTPTEIIPENPVPLPDIDPVPSVEPTPTEPPAEPDAGPDSGTTELIVLAQDMTSLIPGDGGGLLLSGVTGFDATGGAVLIDPDSPNEEIVFYEGIDPGANALVEIYRPVPGFHELASPVAATSTTLASFCEISNLLCPIDDTVVGEVIADYCPNFQCDVDVLIEQMCGPNGATKCDIDGTLLPFVIEELCSLAGGCSSPIPQLIEELLADLCGSEWPGGCDVVGLIERTADEVCPHAGGCTNPILPLIEEQLADLCGSEWPGGCDVVGLIDRIVDEHCPNLSCPQEVIDLIIDTIDETCEGDCAEYLESIVDDLVGEYCPNYQCPADTLDTLTELVAEIVEQVCGSEQECQAVITDFLEELPGQIPCSSVETCEALLDLVPFEELFHDSVTIAGPTCATKVVDVFLVLPFGVRGKSVDIAASNDDTCELAVGPIVTEQGAEAFDQTTDLEVDPLVPELDDITGSGSCSSARANYIHTSHTLQDPPNIDLAWKRTTSRRLWGCDSGWFSERPYRVTSWTGSGPSWWHNRRPKYVHVSWGCHPPNRCNRALAKSYGKLWTDVDHCEDITFKLTTEVRTFSDGHKTVRFRQHGWCAGISGSTDVKVNAERADNFGANAEDKFRHANPPGRAAVDEVLEPE